MSTSSSGTTGDDLAGDDRWQMSDIDGSPEKTIYSSRDGIPSQVFPSALQNVVSKFIKVLIVCHRLSDQYLSVIGAVRIYTLVVTFRNIPT